MSAMAVLTHSPSSPLTTPTSQFTNRRRPMHSIAFNVRRRETKLVNLPTSCKPSTSCIRNFQEEDAETFEVASSGETTEGQDKVADQVFGNPENRTTGTGISFLAKLAIALGVAATITLISVGFKRYMNGSPQGVNYLGHGSPASVLTAPSAGFTLNVFGHKVVIPEYAPGWIYFWLLMAAGCGIAISEEALNIWVGISLSRMLSLDGTWQSFAESFSRNAPYILSTVLWVYWGVCLSDMIPFYLGKLFKQSGASDDVCSKLGIGKEKAMEITRVVQRYGNLAGFVERFSLGVRNPTAFLAGTLVRVDYFIDNGVSPEYFFAGVCCGGLITLPLQVILISVDKLNSMTFSGRVLVEGAPRSCRCNSCICSWTLDGVPIRSSCINCIVPFSPTPLLQLVLLITVCLIHKSQWQNRYKLPKSMIRRHRSILPMVAATLC
ncbi:hypothetical protein RHSIM_Rhsim01G0255600 [Rhododendron simsii]|uniref:Uncharacterized protein n=1 Tax=Rhododendron simsii TaxID=118357 RepID=A0A834HFP2_RHOSS|nr:hypothetical protein RHSIM_Rhsim01G0255600 [Rhododendron simsii]